MATGSRDCVRFAIVVAHGASRRLAADVAEELPEELGEHFPGTEWCAEVREVDPADPTAEPRDLVEALRRRALDEGFDLAVGITDLPLKAGRRPVTAQVNAQHGVALVSLPALGAVGVRRRLHDTVLRLVERLLGDEIAAGAQGRGGDPHEDGTIRFVGATLFANLRLLAGMVRANQPSRVITRLSRAMAGSLGTAAFSLASSNVWKLADSLSFLRLAGLCALSVGSTCIVLVLAHDLWERAPSPASRERIVLFNLATTITLSIGVLCLYLGLALVAAIGAAVLIAPDALSRQLGHPVGIPDYAQLTLLVAALATIGGALASLIESDEAVRDAAYRAREEGEPDAAAPAR
jgi:hypothetical protein